MMLPYSHAMPRKLERKKGKRKMKQPPMLL